MEKTSELVWLYVKRRPFMKEMLKYDLVNYSRFARKLCRDIFNSQSKYYAVRAALMRMAPRIRKREGDMEGKVLEVLKRTKLTIKSKVAVVISSAPLGIDAISHVKSGEYYTYIAEQHEVSRVLRSRSIISVEQDQNLFILSSSPAIETTPGVISNILYLLATEGINVSEFISAYTDTLLVIKEADTSRAYDILSSLLR